MNCFFSPLVACGCVDTASVSSLRLNLGCGKRVLDGFLNLDKFPVDGRVGFLDLDVFPYPFKNDSVDEVVLSHVLEHLVDPLHVVEECHRILKPGGVLQVDLPIHCNILSHLRFEHSSRYLNHFVSERCGIHGSRAYSQQSIV